MTNHLAGPLPRPSAACTAYYSAQSTSSRSATAVTPTPVPGPGPGPGPALSPSPSVARPLPGLAAPAELQRRPARHVVPAGLGYAFEVRRGEEFRIVDLHGKQVVDFAAWVAPQMREKLSMSYTRMRLGGVTPMVGEYLYTNLDAPLFRLVEDTVKVHDMTWPSCFPELYDKLGLRGHRSCATNIAEVMRPYGIATYLDVNDPFNIFQNTPNYALKDLNPSRPGDHIQFRALKDAVCTVSCCPYDLGGFNGGVITDIAVITNVNLTSSTTQENTA